MTEPARDVAVSGGKGVVVGDYATVFQTFADRSRPVAQFVRTGQFQSLVNERTRRFVGREFVFEAVRRAVSGADLTSGYVIINGEPGIGKTAIAASLVLRNSYLHHFNVAAENIRSPRDFLESVCAQLIIRYELPHDTLPPQAGDDSGFLSQLLAEAAANVAARADEAVIVVVDALDEADDAGLAPSANRLYLPPALPDGVFFILTTRNDADYRISVDNETHIWIRDEDPENLADIGRYIDGFIETNHGVMSDRLAAWGLDTTGFVAEMTTLSEGNFMYLVHVLPEIARGRLSRETVGGIHSLPRGLKGYYQRHWRDMKDEDPQRFSNFQRPVLCFLAISGEPVTILQLTDWTGLEPGNVKSVVVQWRQFLNEDSEDRSTRYRIYHRSFADFLDEEENLRWYHGKVVDAALAKIPGFE